MMRNNREQILARFAVGKSYTSPNVARNPAPIGMVGVKHRLLPNRHSKRYLGHIIAEKIGQSHTIFRLETLLKKVGDRPARSRRIISKPEPIV